MHIQNDSTKVYKDEKEAPKFYKRDLLQVLQERNELKEEVDLLREELALTRTLVDPCVIIMRDGLDLIQLLSCSEIRRREARQSLRRPRSETRVREM